MAHVLRVGRVVDEAFPHRRAGAFLELEGRNGKEQDGMALLITLSGGRSFVGSFGTVQCQENDGKLNASPGLMALLHNEEENARFCFLGVFRVQRTNLNN